MILEYEVILLTRIEGLDKRLSIRCWVGHSLDPKTPNSASVAWVHKAHRDQRGVARIMFSTTFIPCLYYGSYTTLLLYVS